MIVEVVEGELGFTYGCDVNSTASCDPRCLQLEL